MLKPFVKCYMVFDVNTHQIKLYKNIEKSGFKHRDYGMEATILNRDPLVISFSSNRNEIGGQTVHLNPVLTARYTEVKDRKITISIEIRSSFWVWFLGGIGVCGLLYNAVTGISEKWENVLVCLALLIVLGFADSYMRTTSLSRFQKWMTKAAAGSV
jgi:hypothetical protein